MKTTKAKRTGSSELRPAPPKTYADIAQEWDRAVSARFRQQASGIDLSFTQVLVPSLEQLLQGCDLSRVLDAGCGSGGLAVHLSKTSKSVVGIDFSEESIAVANKNYGDLQDLSFLSESIEHHAQSSKTRYTTIVANMVLMTTPDLSEVIQAIATLLAPNGHFLWTSTHPWFWPRYWGYSDSPWFRYDKEIAIEGPLNISLEEDGPITTHFHRPLAHYVNAIARCNLVITEMVEPVPSAAIQNLYPLRWEFPRYLTCKVTNHHTSEAD